MLYDIYWGEMTCRQMYLPTGKNIVVIVDKNLRIAFGYLWHNPYYQISKEKTACAPSRVFLATGVTAHQETLHKHPHHPLQNPFTKLWDYHQYFLNSQNYPESLITINE